MLAKGVLGLLVVIPLLGGCLGGNESTTRMDGRLAGVFVVDGETLRREDSAPWVRREAGTDGWNTTTIDWMALQETDRLSLILVQALDDVDVDLDSDRSVTYSPNPVGGEGNTASDFCIFELMDTSPPGEAFLARAAGKTNVIPDESFTDRNTTWIRFGGSGIPLTDFGLSGGSSLAGKLDALDWVGFGAATSGIPPSQLQQDDQEWTLTVRANGPTRVLVLPAAIFLCGAGFSRFGGTDVPPGLAYRGGQLDVLDRFGLTVAFESDARLVNGVPVSLTGSSGALQFGEERVPLADNSNVWRTTFQPLLGSIAIDQWIGNPFWWLVGYSIPHPPELGLDGGNFTVQG